MEAREERAVTTDEDLMMQARDGHMESVSELFKRYHVILFKFFCSHCQDESLSKDMVQNVFERIIKYRKSYSQKFPFKSWLFRLAWNEQNDYYRSKRLSLPGDDQLVNLVSYTDEHNQGDKDEQKIRLRKSINQLSSDQKQLIILTQYKGMNYTEVAEIINCSVPAIKVRVHRTMKALRVEYKNCQVA